MRIPQFLPLMETPKILPSIKALAILPSTKIPHVLPSLIALQEVKEMALNLKPNLDHQENHVKVTEIQ